MRRVARGSAAGGGAVQQAALRRCRHWGRSALQAQLPLLPVLLSYVGVSPAAAARTMRGEFGPQRGMARLWQGLEHFATPRWAGVTVALA